MPKSDILAIMPDNILGSPAAPVRIVAVTLGHFDNQFDPARFRDRSDRDSHGMTTCCRWVLHTARQALRDAGPERPRCARPRAPAQSSVCCVFPTEKFAASRRILLVGEHPSR